MGVINTTQYKEYKKISKTTEADSDIRRGARSDGGAGRLDRAPQGARPGLEGSPCEGRQVECSPQVKIGNPPRTHYREGCDKDNDMFVNYEMSWSLP